MDDKSFGWNSIFVVATMTMVFFAACSRTSFAQKGDAAQNDRPEDAAALPRDSTPAGPDTTLPDASVIVADVHVPAPDASPPSPDAVAPGPDSMATRTDSPPSLVSLLGGRSFDLRADLSAPTVDSACAARPATAWYTLEFSTDIRTVTVFELSARATKPMHGTAGPESDRITYHLDDAFAGGRLTVEWDQGLVVAQLTLYGSGVPVAACLRAPLFPQP